MRQISFIFFLLSLHAVFGQEVDTNGAFEFWTRMNIRVLGQKSIQHDVEFQFRDQQRVASLQERFKLYTLRWYIQKRWKDFYMQSSPVTFFERQTENGDWVNEFRVTQLVGWFLAQDKVQFRTGLEGRFFWTGEDRFNAIRWRSRILVSVPVTSSLKFQVSDEVFLHEGISGREVPVFDQNRISAGLNYRFTKNWSAESGYQYHIRSFSTGEFDQFNIFFLYLFYTL